MSDQIFQFVTFTLGVEEYGLDILEVQEIIRPISITRLPCDKKSKIEGIINLRGKVVPVMDLRKNFGFDIQETKYTRIVIVNHKESILGLVVDTVSEVLRINSDEVEMIPPTLDDTNKMLSGIVKVKDKLLLILDVEAVLSKVVSDK